MPSYHNVLNANETEQYCVPTAKNCLSQWMWYKLAAMHWQAACDNTGLQKAIFKAGLKKCAKWVLNFPQIMPFISSLTLNIFLPLLSLEKTVCIKVI